MPPKMIEKPAEKPSPEKKKATAARSRELEAALSSITKTYGEGSIMRLGDARAARQIEVIPDIICHAGGVTVAYDEWLQNQRLEHGTEGEVNRRLEQAIKKNYAIIRDVACNRPQRTPIWDSRPYCVGKEVDVRTAAMVLALKRIEAHYLLEGFSQ